MENSIATVPKSKKVSGTWSTKARSGSPRPTLEPSDARSTRSTKMPEDNNKTKTQLDALYGVGSQFLPIDDSVKNKDIHPNL